MLEVCPTSNIRIGGIANPSQHPVHRFLEHDLPIVVASDDPGIFGTSLADELAWIERHTCLTREQTRELAAAAWRSRSEVLSGRESACPSVAG